MEERDFISKTRRKRQMHDLQAVGAELVKLSHEQLERLGLPAPLLEAVLDAKRFTKHEALRRQMQYIGRIMRDLDPAPIIEQLERLRAPNRKQTALLHIAERWRQELITDPQAVARFVREFPEADPHLLRELAEGAREERAAEKPPKRFRELFHLLNAIVQDHARKSS